MKMDSGIRNAREISFEEKISQFASVYKVPLILGVVGIIFIISSVLLLSKRAKQKEVTFIQQESTGSSRLSSTVIVDISGGVINPGVYELPIGDRIGDLVVMAGGFSSGADRTWIAKNLNQAARVVDGTKLYIPLIGEPKEAQALVNSDTLGVSSDGVININLALQSEIESLPGIGPVTAAKIISSRPYATIEEVQTKKVVGKATYEKIKDLITIY